MAPGICGTEPLPAGKMTSNSVSFAPKKDSANSEGHQVQSHRYGQLHRLREDVLPVTTGRHKHASFRIRLDQRAGRRHLSSGRALEEDLQLQRVQELQFVKRGVTKR